MEGLHIVYQLKKKMVFNDNKLIIEELARKYHTSYEVIKEVVESPFEFMYNTLRDLDKNVDEMPEFRIPRFGTFNLKYQYKKKQNEDKELQHRE